MDSGRGNVFRLQERSDRPQGWPPRNRGERGGCENDAAGGEVPWPISLPWGPF